MTENHSHNISPHNISPHNISPHIAILGAGGWGTALAVMLAKSGRNVCLWARRPEAAWQLREDRRNPDYLGDIVIPEGVVITSSLTEALEHSLFALITLPSAAIPELLPQLPRDLGPNWGIVLCAKGLAADGSRLSLAAQDLGFARVGVLSGPNHAEEVALRLPAATVVASSSMEFTQQVQGLLLTSSFRVYTSSDVVGVELGGVLKNVVALAAGILDGLGAGDNAKAALITRGLLEMSRYLGAQGAETDTVYGLSGLGDLVATCTSPHSRNRAAGEALARGNDPSQGAKVVEGIRTATLLDAWATLRGFDLPIVSAVASILRGECSAREALEGVMDRPAKSE